MMFHRRKRPRGGRIIAQVPIDSAHVLLVDPMHVDPEMLDWLLEPRPEMGGRSVGVILHTPGGDGRLSIVSDADNGTATLVHSADDEGDFTNATDAKRMANLAFWHQYQAEEQDGDDDA
ncbi:hypothetical protein JCM13591A_17460 [Microbacterium xylanilyticum]